MGFKTEQEAFWNGEFGDEYVERNKGQDLLSSYVGMWAKIINRIEKCESVLEFGSNIGLNLKAIKRLKPNMKCNAIEINHKAATILRNDEDFKDGSLNVNEGSILEYEGSEKVDMTLICGVLIHINPDELNTVYEKLYNNSNRYILINEYYNPSPVEIMYRGHEGKLFKRDFAGEFMDKYPDVRLVDYGFVYHRDNNFPGDDATWFLMEKK